MRVSIRDVVALIGLVLIGVGCWWIYPPVACVIMGVILLGGSVWGHAYDPE